MFKNRDSYRNICGRDDLFSYKVTVKETNLFVMTDKFLEKEIIEIILKHRGHLENYMDANPGFMTALVPWHSDQFAPPIVRAMIEAGSIACVGPMAAVAGSVSQFVGEDLSAFSSDVFIENGGDIYIRTTKPVTIGLFAGKSPLSGKIGLKFQPGPPFGVCTSSGTVGHSLSFGKADAICIYSSSCSLADAAATAVGNIIKKPADIQPALEMAKNIPGVKGALVVLGKQMGGWGDMEIVPL
ncbi:UPF0280 family protein [Desulforegula conservatrix]|uniref:UPF0280 family protein n=1 Tax=Desulforegula conservatrix TaxID=153026 RepID=UPI0004071253|nr:UPF0280 family protein [Desulforegula conservatrix]